MAKTDKRSARQVALKPETSKLERRAGSIKLPLNQWSLSDRLLHRPAIDKTFVGPADPTADPDLYAHREVRVRGLSRKGVVQWLALQEAELDSRFRTLLAEHAELSERLRDRTFTPKITPRAWSDDDVRSRLEEIDLEFDEIKGVSPDDIRRAYGLLPVHQIEVQRADSATPSQAAAVTTPTATPPQPRTAAPNGVEVAKRLGETTSVHRRGGQGRAKKYDDMKQQALKLVGTLGPAHKRKHTLCQAISKEVAVTSETIARWIGCWRPPTP